MRRLMKMKNRLIGLRLYVLWFVIFLIFGIVTRFLFGDAGGKGFSFGDKTPYTWEKIVDNFAYFLLEASLLALFVVTIFVQVKKKQEQDIEAARKRIAEREKDGENSKTRVDEIVKDVMKSSKQEEETSEKE